MFNTIKFLCLLFFFQVSFITYAQVTPQPAPAPAKDTAITPVKDTAILPAKDTVREFEIIRGPSMRAIKLDSVTTLQTIAGGAIVKQGTTIFHGDSLVINPTTHVVEAFGNIEINQADSLHTYAQYLKYMGQEKVAHLTKNVKLTDKKGTLYTQDFDYNLESGIGNFHNGGKVIEGKNVITSIDGTYYADTKDIYFKKNVKLDGPKNHVRADSLLYNMQTKQSTFISETNIKNDEVEINTKEGTYDLNTGNAFFTSRTTVKDSSGRRYTANKMALENNSGNAQLEGDAVIIDSANSFIAIGNQIFINKKNNSFLATRKPVLIIIQKNDSTYIAADTIYSGFTTFVKNENVTLKKDSVINVSLPENEKIHNIGRGDSLYTDFSKRQKSAMDSINATLPKADSLKSLLPAINHQPTVNNNIQPTGDSTNNLPGAKKMHELIRKERDTSPNKLLQKEKLFIDSAKTNPNQNDSLIKPDKAKMPMGPKEDITEKREKDRVMPGNEMDSLSVDSLKKKDGIMITDSSKSISADSTAKTDSVRYFLAFHHVRIFNDSLQSISDSMFLSTKDSVIRLYYSPVIWSGHTQITGDTIYLFTKNKKPERLYVFNTGMIVNKTKEGFYNQMAGKTINGYFVNGKIDYMRVKGTQSESIYYMQDDDSAYIGMNRATGDVIDIYFKNEEIKKVIFINNINGDMYPMKKIPGDKRELKNFQWLDEKRPKNKLELFE
ncbi:MAG: OstA-like protein [Bacteroidota bacterium]|nr:OstA-like protein [Bacteroidota bacterium]